MIEKVREQVYEFLNNEHSGHGIDHVNRVYNLAVKFAKEEKANIEIVSLASLLHDVDDYKMVGNEKSLEFYNAKRIMKESSIPLEKQEVIIEIIKNMGYSKSLKGIRPTTLEGKCVSDADLCDSLGATGTIRSIVYAVSDKGTGVVFDKNIFPLVDMENVYNKYGTNYGEHDNAINYFFDKLLKIKDLMMTASGKKEALIRHEFMITFLREFFREEDNPEWQDFLEKYILQLN